MLLARLKDGARGDFQHRIGPPEEKAKLAALFCPCGIQRGSFLVWSGAAFWFDFLHRLGDLESEG